MFDTAKALDTIQSFLQEAGVIAMQGRTTAKKFAKADASLVTETDLAISALAHQKLASYLADATHVLIDEESIDTIGLPVDVFQKSEYQWVLDPIDGTVPYAYGLDTFAVMLGLLHKGVPLAAGIYFPAKESMILADDQQAFTLDADGNRHVYTPSEAPAVGRQVMLQISGLKWETAYIRDKSYALCMTGENAAHMFTVTNAGQVAGSCGQGYMSLWDITAPAIIGQRLGVSYVWHDGLEPMFPLHANNLKPNWKLGREFVAAYPQNVQRIAEIVTEAHQFVKEKNL